MKRYNASSWIASGRDSLYPVPDWLTGGVTSRLENRSKCGACSHCRGSISLARHIWFVAKNLDASTPSLKEVGVRRKPSRETNEGSVVEEVRGHWRGSGGINKNE